jgi:hypothetical protein
MANHRWKSDSIEMPARSSGGYRLSSQWSYYWIAFLIVPSLIWIRMDRSVWPWDQSWYGQVSADLWFWLLHSPAQWVATMADGINMKPPGICWLGQLFVPLGGVFGSIEAALLFSVLLTQFATLLLLFRIGQGLSNGGRLVPTAGVLFAAASQLFVGLSHQVFVEPLQALATVWTFYIALKCPAWPKARILVHLGAALVLGLLAKATTPLYCLLPCLYCSYFLVRRPGGIELQAEWKRWPSRALMVAFVCLAVACALWYHRHFADVWQHVHDASFGDVALNYGVRDSIIHKLALWWGLLAQSFLSPYLSWGYLVAIGTAGAVYLFTRGKRPFPISPVAILGASQIGLMLFVFSSNITVEPRYMYALLPCASIVFMQFCVSLPEKALFVVMALGMAQWALINSVSLGLAGRLADQSQWLQPIHPDRSQYDELEQVVRLTDSPEHYNIVGVEVPWLNANSASFFAAKRSLAAGPRGYYTSLGYAQKDVDAAMSRIAQFQAGYIITLDESHQSATPDFLNIVSSPVLARMRGDRRFRHTPFATRDGIVIFQFQPGAASIQSGSGGER